MKTLIKNYKTFVPVNQKQQVIYYLLNFKDFSLKDVILDGMFYKYQTRQNDIELVHGEIASKKVIKFTNKFGNKGYYFEYNSLLSKTELLKLAEKL